MNQDNHQAADELDAFLTARQAGEQASMPPNVAPEEAALADTLLRLAEEARPDPAFAEALEAQLRTRAGARQQRREHAIGGLAGLLSWLRTMITTSAVSRRAAAPWGRWQTWAAAAALILAMLLAVPPVRASVLEFLRIGAVRIFLAESTPTSFPTAPTVGTPGPIASTPLASALDLAGETTLAQARQQTAFAIRLPSYPQDLGQPDRVFVQDLGGTAVVLVWMDANNRGQVRLSLHELGPGIDVQKKQPPAIERITVRGQPAVWTAGPYMLEIYSGKPGEHEEAARRLVTGHVLVWAEGEITYRLETDLPLDEAVRVAESLH
jgi:hypothetical protein